MEALIAEVIKYVLKFVCMIICAAAGISVGKVIRKKKNEKLANEQAE